MHAGELDTVTDCQHCFISFSWPIYPLWDQGEGVHPGEGRVHAWMSRYYRALSLELRPEQKPKRTLIIKSLLWPSVGSVLVVHMCLADLTGEFQSPLAGVGYFFRPSYKNIWQPFAPSCNTAMFKRVYDLMKLLVSVLPCVYTHLFNSYRAVRPRWRQHL